MACRANVVVFVYVAITLVSVLITFMLSVAFGHTNAFLPHLSYLGDKPLESTVFTQCFVVDAAALMLLVQIRFVQVFHCLNKKKASEKAFSANLVGVFAGHSAAVGLFFLACFQETNAFYVHHLAGVFLYFFSSVVYFTAQSVVSSKMAFDRKDRLILKFRIFLSFLVILLFLAFEIGYLVALKQFRKPWEERNKWTEEDGGWIPHLLSAGSEWLLLVLFQLYFLTFYYDFRNVSLTKTRIIVTFDAENAPP